MPTTAICVSRSLIAAPASRRLRGRATRTPRRAGACTSWRERHHAGASRATAGRASGSRWTARLTGPPPPPDLVEEVVLLRDREVAVLRPRDAEELIDEAAFDRDEQMPYWA